MKCKYVNSISKSSSLMLLHKQDRENDDSQSFIIESQSAFHQEQILNLCASKMFINAVRYRKTK